VKGAEENGCESEEVGYWAESWSKGLIWEEEGYRKEEDRE